MPLRLTKLSSRCPITYFVHGGDERPAHKRRLTKLSSRCRTTYFVRGGDERPAHKRRLTKLSSRSPITYFVREVMSGQRPLITSPKI